MKIILLYLCIVLLVQSCNQANVDSSDKLPDRQDKDKYQLVWQDEFDYSGLPDSTKWDYDAEGNEAGWGNNEAQYYSEANEKNAYVENSVLNIIAHKENFEGKEYTSARLVSKADWKYGKIEVNAKIPKATGTWSAIWMMPGGWSFSDGNWPDVGEIDIMEHVGHDPGVVHSTIHCKDYNGLKRTQKTGIINVPDIDKEFHTYILEWTPELIKGFVGDSLYFEYKNEGFGESKWPYYKPYYLILNIAVGGAWGGEQGIDKNAFPQTMEVDYVRVYQKNEGSEKQ